MASLQINNVSKRFGNVDVLKNINLEIENGEFLVLVGPSGCGKTTLLNIVAGLESSGDGDIRIGDRIVNNVHPKDRDIAMVFQSYALYPNMTVRKNITFGLEIRGMPNDKKEAALQRAAKLLQIEPLLDRKPKQLSGGQRQRVAMGRALVRDPAIFLFDEPLSNLDARLRVEMRAEIKKLHQRLGTTIVYVTHDQIEAMTLATRIAIMKDGCVQQFADPQTVYEKPANIFVAGFIGSPSMNFVPGKITRTGDALHFSINKMQGALHLKLPDDDRYVKAWLEKEVIMGIRPEHITHERNADQKNQYCCAIESTVSVIEPTGADVMAHFMLGDHEVIARINPDQRPRPGEDIRLIGDMRKALFFDPDTGMRI